MRHSSAASTVIAVVIRWRNWSSIGEYGSGGREIGRRIAERTGIEFYDSRVIAGSDLDTYSLPLRMYGAIAEVIRARMTCV